MLENPHLFTEHTEHGFHKDGFVFTDEEVRAKTVEIKGFTEVLKEIDDLVDREYEV